MLYFNSITQKQYYKLEKINKNIGKIWKVNWDNIEFDNNLVLYAIYDVIYLKKLLINIFKKFNEKSMINEFYDIQKLTIFVNLKRNKINYDMKLNINNLDKYRVIDYFKNII